MSPTVSDFALGALCSVSLAMALLLALIASGAIWLVRMLGRWSEVTANRGESGNVTIEASLRGRGEQKVTDRA